MKILFVAETLTYGGAARRFVDLANALVNRNHKVSMLVYNDTIHIGDLIDSKIHIVKKRIKNNNLNWFNRNIIYRSQCINLLNKFIKNSEFEVIISFNDMVNINVLLSKEAAKKKIIISERSDPYYNKLYLKIIKRLIFNRADGIVFQTEGAQGFFGGKIKCKTCIIPNPIPNKGHLTKYNGPRKKVIVSVARLWLYQKRQDILLKAFKEFKQAFDESYTLILYGDGPDEQKIKDLIIQLKLENNVILAGVHHNILDVIKDASMFVLSSDFEGIPNSLIEAMTLGLPVISTDCSPGGARFLIQNGENGLLVERDNSHDLAKAISFIARNPEEANRMGNNAISIIDLLNSDRIYDQWEKFIDDL